MRINFLNKLKTIFELKTRALRARVAKPKIAESKRIYTKKALHTFLAIALFSTSFNFFYPAYKNATTKATGMGSQGVDACTGELEGISSATGGVKLDMVANFLADMSGVTGAYFDQANKRFVIVGPIGGALPESDPDDTAVAIKSILKYGADPFVKFVGKELAQSENLAGAEIAVQYSEGLLNTNFGKTLFRADYALKSMLLATHVDSDYKVVNSGSSAKEKEYRTWVPSYKSLMQRFQDNGGDKSDGQKTKQSEFWLKPSSITLTHDAATNSFVYKDLAMEVTFRKISGPTAYNNAGRSIAADLTANYDKYALKMKENGNSSWVRLKQLAGIVGTVKWMKEKALDQDYSWAYEYDQKYNFTPEVIKTQQSAKFNLGGTDFRIYGGLKFDTAPNYVSGSTDLKTKAQEAAKDASLTHWEFNYNGVKQRAVAVDAALIKNQGYFSHSETDINMPMRGEAVADLTRTYSSTSERQQGLGKGWSFLPAQLIDRNPAQMVSCTPTDKTLFNGNYPKGLTFESNGQRYDFAYTCGTGYAPTDSATPLRLIKQSTGNYAVFDDVSGKIFYFDTRNRLYSVLDKYNFATDYLYKDAKFPERVSQISTRENIPNAGYITGIAINYQGQGRTSNPNTGLAISSRDHNNRYVYYKYNANRQLISATDFAGKETKYEYDPVSNRLSKIINKLGQTVLTNEYNDRGQITKQTDILGREVSNTYDVVNKAVTSTDNLGRSSVSKYDDKGRLLETTNTLGNKTTYSYSGNLTSPIKIKNEAFKTEQSFEYDAKGFLTKLTDQRGGTITNSYQKLDRLFVPTLTIDKTGPTEAKSEYVYDTAGVIKQVKVTKGSFTSTKDLTISRGALLEVKDTTGGETRTQKFSVDSHGNVYEVRDAQNNLYKINKDGWSRLIGTVSPTGLTISHTLDMLGRQIKTVTPTGTIERTFDDLSRVVSTQTTVGTQVEKLSFVYSKTGMLEKVTSADGSDVTYAYNKDQTLASRLNALGKETKYEYESRGAGIEGYITPSGNKTVHSYLANGLKDKVTTPEGNRLNFKYDDKSRLIELDSNRGNDIQFAYDQFDRVTEVTNREGKVTTSYTPLGQVAEVTDSNGGKTNYEYDSRLRKKAIVYPEVNGKRERVEYGYDILDRVISVKTSDGKETKFEYNAESLVTKKVFPNGVSEEYTYDRGLLKSITIKLAGVVKYSAIYERDTRGRLTKQTENGEWLTSTLEALPTGSGASKEVILPAPKAQVQEQTTPQSGVEKEATPPALPQEQSDTHAVPIPVKKSGKQVIKKKVSLLMDELMNFEFVRSAKAAEPVRPLGGGDIVTTYEYSKDGNLVKSTRDGKVTSFTYDKFGNLLKAVANGVDQSYTYGMDDQMLTANGKTLETNKDGQVTKIDSTRLDWDATSGKLSEYGTTKFSYDGTGILKSINSSGVGETKYHWDASSGLEQLLTVSPPAGGANGASVVVPGISQTTLGKRVFYHYDGVGNLAFGTDETGKLVSRQRYNEWGEFNERSGQKLLFGYKGELTVDSSGLVYMRARFYSPTLKRFISRDPLSGTSDSYISQNAYLFAGNDPVNNADPTGLKTEGLTFDFGIIDFENEDCVSFIINQKDFDFEFHYKGMPIGIKGSTGRSSGPHLHFEVWSLDSNNRKKKALNPLIFLEDGLVGSPIDNWRISGTRFSEQQWGGELGQAHLGLDLDGSNNIIRAATNVDRIEKHIDGQWNWGYGNYIDIYDYELGVMTRYAHLTK